MVDIRPKKGPALLLAEAKIIANARFSEWPDEFSPAQVAALMAGGWRREYRASYSTWLSVVTSSLLNSTLIARSVPQKSVATLRNADSLRAGGRFGDTRFPIGDRISVRAVYTETRTPPPRRYVDRKACADWLRSIREQPSEHISEWLRVGGIIFGDTETPQVQPASGGRGPSLNDRRIEVILEVLSSMGYAVMSIPDGGKGAAMTECLKRSTLFTASTFDNAWKKASKDKRLAMAKKAIYSGGRE